MKKLLTFLFLFATTIAYPQFTPEQKEKILIKLIESKENKEILDNCIEYSKVQSSVISTLENKSNELNYAFAESKYLLDSVVKVNYLVKKELLDAKGKVKSRNKFLVIISGLVVVLTYALSNK